MKQLVILSGKGGTGKTSITAALAHLSTQPPRSIDIVLADADVDASNLGLVVKASNIEQTDFWGGRLAEINGASCMGCGVCEEVCRFEAVSRENGIYKVDPLACEGCAACHFACPENAISMIDQIAGKWFRSSCEYGPLFQADLFPGQENSGKLVALIKQHAKIEAIHNGHDLVFIDGPPGVACPVISASSGADIALVVVEPTLAGIHDMKRTLEMTNAFDLVSVVCINKFDLYIEGTREIEQYCREHNIPVLGRIPFDLDMTRAVAEGQPVTVFQPKSAASQALREIWDRMSEMISMSLEDRA